MQQCYLKINKRRQEIFINTEKNKNSKQNSKSKKERGLHPFSLDWIFECLLVSKTTKDFVLRSSVLQSCQLHEDRTSDMQLLPGITSKVQAIRCM